MSWGCQSSQMWKREISHWEKASKQFGHLPCTLVNKNLLGTNLWSWHLSGCLTLTWFTNSETAWAAPWSKSQKTDLSSISRRNMHGIARIRIVLPETPILLQRTAQSADCSCNQWPVRNWLTFPCISSDRSSIYICARSIYRAFHF